MSGAESTEPADTGGAARWTCPPEDVLDVLAAGGVVGAAVAEHVRGCPRCRAEVDRVKTSEALLTDLFARAGGGPDGGVIPGAAPTTDSAAGLVPGYRLLGVLHSGGQGTVHRAVHEETGRTAAVKLLLAGRFATAAQRRRFEREAEIAASLKHANVVTIYDSRRLADGRHAIVMEFIDGVPLDQWHPPGRTPRERARAWLSIIAQVCDAAEHAHRNGVIHRDLKPSNVLVERDEQGSPRAKVLDFGVARPREQAGHGVAITQAGEFAGTLEYASPEQVLEAQDASVRADARSDVYSIGVMLYRVVCGVHPYPMDGSILQAARTIVETEPAAPSSVAACIDRDLETIVLKALHKTPARRYATAGALADDLRRYLAGEAIDARRDSAVYMFRKAVRRHWAAIAVIAAMVIVPTVLYVQELRTERARAERELEVSRKFNLASSGRATRGRLEAAEGRMPDGERLLMGALLEPMEIGNTHADLRAEAYAVERRNIVWALRSWYLSHPCTATLSVGLPVKIGMNDPSESGGLPRIVLADEYGSAEVLDMATGEPVSRRPTKEFDAALFEPPSWARIGSSWRIGLPADSGETARELIGHSAMPVRLAALQRRWLASVDETGVLKLWDLEPMVVSAPGAGAVGEEVVIERVMFVDEDTLIARTAGGALTKVSVGTNPPRIVPVVAADSDGPRFPPRRMDTDGSSPLAGSLFSVLDPAGTSAFGLFADGRMRRFSAPPRVRARGEWFMVSDGPVVDMEMSTAGKFIALAAADGVVVMDAEIDPRRLAFLARPSPPLHSSDGGTTPPALTCVAVSPSGRRIAAADAGGMVHVWMLERADACIAGNLEYQARNHERAEKVRYDRGAIERLREELLGR